jgi:hypothetical protein
VLLLKLRYQPCVQTAFEFEELFEQRADFYLSELQNHNRVHGFEQRSNA